LREGERAREEEGVIQQSEAGKDSQPVEEREVAREDQKTLEGDLEECTNQTAGTMAGNEKKEGTQELNEMIDERL
jgi:hypothetical protein